MNVPCEKIEAFIYYKLDNGFFVKKGFIYRVQHKHFLDITSSFSVNDFDLKNIDVLDEITSNGFVEGIIVDEAPGKVYNNTLWLKERDDEKARVALLELEMTKVNAHQNKILYHLKNIKILASELKEEF